MRRILLVLLSAALLAGCNAAVPSAATSEAAQTPAPSETPTVTPAATPEPGLPYEEIRTPVCYDSVPARPCEGYFTMEQNGLWGLMRADGTELLPCKAASPVSQCGAAGHWIWFASLGAEKFDEYAARLEASGDGTLCGGHGGLSNSFFYNLDAPGLDRSGVDLTGLYCYRLSEQGQVIPMQEIPLADQLWDLYGDLLPVYSAHLEGGAGDPAWPGPLVESARGDGAPIKWWYISRQGYANFTPDLDQAGWFFDEALAPVETQGHWAYLDREGNLATEAVYDPVCDTVRDQTTGEVKPDAAWAAHMQNGYAVVRQGDAWGLLDDTGAEVIPCEKAGVAWEGSTLWVKEDGGWVRTEPPTT